MGCPINDVRKFKETRQTTTAGNVVGIRGESPVASLHHARADEASSIEVSISVQQPNSTHEENIMKQEINETNELLKDTMNNVNETMDDLVNDIKAAVSEEDTTVFIDEDEVLNRMKKLRRFDITNTVVSSAVMMASSAIIAKTTDRSVGGAVFISGLLSALNIACCTNSAAYEIGRKWVAVNGTDADVAQRGSHSMGTAAGALTVAVATGAIIGRFFTKKNVTE